MSSLSNSALLSFGENQYKALMYDDYPLGKVQLNVKASLGAEVGGLAIYKTIYNTLEQRLSNEVRLQFPWDRYTFFIGSRNGNEYKFHLDFGRFQFGDYYPNFYASAKFDNKELKNMRLGTVLTVNKLTCNARILHSGEHVRLHEKCNFRHNEWDFIKILQWPLTHPTDPVRWDAQVAYRQPNYELYFKHISTDTKKYRMSGQYFDDGYFGLGGLVKQTGVNLGLESFFRYGKVIGSLALETEITKNTWAKVKVTDSYLEGIGPDLRDLSMTVAVKTIQKTITTTVGVHVPMQGVSKRSPIDYPWGIQVDLNV